MPQTSHRLPEIYQASGRGGVRISTPEQFAAVGGTRTRRWWEARL